MVRHDEDNALERWTAIPDLMLESPMLRALNAYTASLAGAPADGLAREVYLRDAPDAELRKMSVAEVLLQEFRHAEEHVEEIRKTRQHHRV